MRLCLRPQIQRKTLYFRCQFSAQILNDEVFDKTLKSLTSSLKGTKQLFHGLSGLFSIFGQHTNKIIESIESYSQELNIEEYNSLLKQCACRGLGNKSLSLLSSLKNRGMLLSSSICFC
jgi:hypothetical protein